MPCESCPSGGEVLGRRVSPLFEQAAVLTKKANKAMKPIHRRELRGAEFMARSFLRCNTKLMTWLPHTFYKLIRLA